jgi:hypothetical protein
MMMMFILTSLTKHVSKEHYSFSAPNVSTVSCSPGFKAIASLQYLPILEA